MSELKELHRTCLFCKHFDINAGETGWSEETPGSSFSMACCKGKWEFGNDDTEEHFKECLLTGDTCDFYEDCLEAKQEAR